MAWIGISLFLQEAARGENFDNIVRTLSYRKLPEENTDMVKPAENETSKQPQSWTEAAKAAGVLVPSSQEQFDQVIVETAPKKSATKKTPKEYRLEEPKKKASSILSKFDKKNFKEAFITDKSRFLKRQPKYNRSKKILIGSGSETAGMIIAYGGGPLKEKFLKGEISYNPNEYFIHANATDFAREFPQVNPSQEVPTNQKKRRLLE